MYVKGVNLGNWLVLEKWMSPALFDGTTAAYANGARRRRMMAEAVGCEQTLGG